MGAVSSLIINTLSQFSLTLKLTRGLFENWRLPPFYKPDLTHTVCTLIQQAPPDALSLVPRACRFPPSGGQNVDAARCFMTVFTFFCCCCFTDKSFVRTTRPSRCSDKLVASYSVSWINSSYYPNP